MRVRKMSFDSLLINAWSLLLFIRKFCTNQTLILSQIQNLTNRQGCKWGTWNETYLHNLIIMTLIYALTALVMTWGHLIHVSLWQSVVDLAVVHGEAGVHLDNGVLVTRGVRVLSVENQVDPDHANDEDADGGHNDGRQNATVLENILWRGFSGRFWLIDKYLISFQLIRRMVIHQRQTLGETRFGKLGWQYFCHNQELIVYRLCGCFWCVSWCWCHCCCFWNDFRQRLYLENPLRNWRGLLNWRFPLTSVDHLEILRRPGAGVSKHCSADLDTAVWPLASAGWGHCTEAGGLNAASGPGGGDIKHTSSGSCGADSARDSPKVGSDNLDNFLILAE